MWAEKVETLLPKADRVVFCKKGVNNETLYGFADWEKVEALFVDLMEPLPYYPTFYHVREFPAEEQLKKIGVVFVEKKSEK